MTASPVKKEPEHKGLVIGASGLVIAGVLTTFLAPLVTNSFAKDFGFGTGDAGILVAVGLAGVAVAAFAISPVLDKLDRRKVGVIGAVTATAGLAATGLVATSFYQVLIAQLITGLGAGLAYAAANSALAFARYTEKAYSTTTIAYMLFGAAMLMLGPTLHDLYPMRGLYLGMAVAEGLCILLIWRLPDVRTLPQAAVTTLTTGQDSPATKRTGLRRFTSPGAVLVVAFLIMNTGNMAIWTFAQTIGEGSGMSTEGTSAFLGISQLVGLIGAGVTLLIGGKVNKMLILIPSVTLLALANLVVGIAWVPIIFMLGFVIVNISYFCLSPLILALAAELDPLTGKLAVYVAGVVLVGGAMGPAVGGFVSGEEQNWAALGIVAAAMIMISLPMLAIPARSAKAAAQRQADQIQAANTTEEPASP